MLESLNGLSIRNIQETLNDTIFYRDEVRQLFNHGKITLRERSLAENIFWTTLNRILQTAKQSKNAPAELSEIETAALRYLLLQFQPVPIAARQLGDRSAVPGHAHPPPQ